MKRALIADDHPQTVSVCRAALAGGHSVVVAGDLALATSAVQRDPADLILLDAALPGGPLHAFVLKERGRGARILLLVPPRMSADALEPLRSMADAILHKPFSAEDLKARIAQMVESRALPQAAESPVRYEAANETGGAERVAEETSMLTDASGMRIAGCALERFLGRGSGGCVYLARHEMLDVPVAVKLLPTALLQWTPQDRQRFVRGARAAARVQHPNVVQLFNAGEEQGYLFLVQRYVEGESLGRRLDRLGPLPESEALLILAQVAAGLAAVHRLGLVHRDVKPGNILLDAAGQAHLGDFGLARDAGTGDISSITSIVGTPLYMSPEQCAGQPVDARADLYSLGATIYHALTGHPPIEGKTALEVLRGHERTVPVAPHLRKQGISAGASRLVMRLLAKKPEGRFESAEEVVEAAGRAARAAEHD